MSQPGGTSHNDQHLARAAQAIGSMGLVSPLPAPPVAAAPGPDETWDLDGGWAWVYYGAGNGGLVRPLVLSDGFDSGPSLLDHIWDGWNGQGFPFFSELLARGRSLVIIGYAERSASILDNAEVAIEAILKTIRNQPDRNGGLVVGGYSMGGLITRYALAKMEFEGEDHQTATYFSYDTPHGGAWIPISVQAFAHYSKELNSAFSDQVNSPAARQMLWRHIETVEGKPAEDPLRTEFLAELRRVGSWPSRPRKIGVANGAGNGTGNQDVPGDAALRCTDVLFDNTALYIQASSAHQLVAELRSILLVSKDVYTDGFPEGDGAPGGQLSTFKLIADALNQAVNGNTELFYPDTCFIPTVSAVAIRDIGTNDGLYTNVDNLPPSESELDEFQCASTNEGHIHMTPEHGKWLLERLSA
ncbi:hypothetical protein [Streptomyces sp. CBMA123]|uniref:hypothetical protein n=1 Tax=Streptomyces sp. CBMA123 TaxID=1896313 RepID=UPI001CB7F13B|nr:hypothetical protein [Streptomyces sp. CBMA123]MBD0692588.1 hypothetical protein [Streptomyces sp. CBMA123]